MDYWEMSLRVRFRLILAFAIVVFIGIAFVLAETRGGSLSGVMGIKNFTLCQADSAGGTPRPLASLILSPTTVVHACGYVDVRVTYPADLCFYYQLEKGNETVFRPKAYYCVSYHSQYFSFPVTTTELLVPGAYELYTYPDAARDSPESVYFEIRPGSK